MPTPRKQEDAEAQSQAQTPPPPAEETETPLSRDARFSTYSENSDVEDAHPPNGPFVVQELGTPKED